MISVIVPIYKVEDYIAVCIDSILASTYRDFELILVDDGSPDNCGRICDEYAARDHRIRVIHQRNQGVAAARNSGMKAALGKYVSFIDSDDMIHPLMLEVLHDAITSGDYDFSMVYGKMVQDKGIGYDYAKDQGPINFSSRTILTQEKFMSSLVSLDYFARQYHVVWNKLYKKSLVDGVEFVKTGGEDFEWVNRVCLRMNKAILVKAGLYYYIQRDSSLMHSGVNELFADRINSALLSLDAIPEDNVHYRALHLKFIYSLMFFMRHKSRNSDLNHLLQSNCRNAYKKTRHELISNPQISWGKKLLILFNYHCPWIYNTILDLILFKQRTLGA